MPFTCIVALRRRFVIRTAADRKRPCGVLGRDIFHPRRHPSVIAVRYILVHLAAGRRRSLSDFPLVIYIYTCTRSQSVDPPLKPSGWNRKSWLSHRQPLAIEFSSALLKISMARTMRTLILRWHYLILPWLRERYDYTNNKCKEYRSNNEDRDGSVARREVKIHYYGQLERKITTGIAET